MSVDDFESFLTTDNFKQTLEIIKQKHSDPKNKRFTVQQYLTECNLMNDEKLEFLKQEFDSHFEEFIKKIKQYI
ncbi:hypothetical protein AAEX28_15050 [Lentisphaerota bacterium WC36G]|nr:hypothetical protein LJT99_01805 [Lentisphaerae bacterium WC36]